MKRSYRLNSVMRRPFVSGVFALFAYYVPGIDEIQPAPSYFVLASNDARFPLHGNVSDKTFREANLPIPPTPPYETWKRFIEEKRKCGRCYKSTKTKADHAHHMFAAHGVL